MSLVMIKPLICQSVFLAIGNRLGILSFQIRHQAAHIHQGILFWLMSPKRSYNELGKLFQSLHHAISSLRFDINFPKNFTFSYLE